MALCPENPMACVRGCRPTQWYIPVEAKFPCTTVEPACPRVNCPVAYNPPCPPPQTLVPAMIPCGWVALGPYLTFKPCCTTSC
ncbi:hypothetical protein KPH14_004903 [Odynerus spinipes]|uniref:Uncharacterized protein n=1 Tax=Odynerus spinipes TaxID=1348599 RepID=A0AAD9VPT1_9HYME|nr:hypothetical protein KPH14_004903 [Odynerus spinipes]